MSRLVRLRGAAVRLASLASLVLLVPLVSAALTGCARYGDEGRAELAVPGSAGFAPLGLLLGLRCGSLDCHGDPARNLRVYGEHGLRARGEDVTGDPDTTDADLAATYDALIGLDPEGLAAVYADGGRAPERWLVFRKALGRQSHVGGAALPEGAPGDLCLRAWLSGESDAGVCLGDTFGPDPLEGETW